MKNRMRIPFAGVSYYNVVLNGVPLVLRRLVATTSGSRLPTVGDLLPGGYHTRAIPWLAFHNPLSLTDVAALTSDNRCYVKLDAIGPAGRSWLGIIRPGYKTGSNDANSRCPATWESSRLAQHVV